MRLTGKMRVGIVILALVAPSVWIAPGCGARSDIGDEDDLEFEEDGGADADARPDVQPDVGPDVQPDVSPDVVPDVVLDVTPDVQPDVVPDVELDVAPDVQPDVQPDVVPDVEPDVPPDVEPDVPPDVEPDVPPDVEPDVPPDVEPDVPPDVVPDGCTDGDGDGYTTCEEDCDDADPLVNPGAFDFINGDDDDCDGIADNPFISCGAGLQYTSQDPVDYARAIDLCQVTTEGATGADKRWGLISAEFLLANGTGTPAPQSHAIITSFGSVLGPRMNENFVFTSSGLAGAPGQPYWQPGTPQFGTDTGTFSPAPPGFPTNKAGCPFPASNLAFNPVNLKLRIRVPTNARSFGFDHSFFSAEYPEFACSQFNDLWVALLDTGASGIANNHNIVFDNQGTPGSVNLNYFDRCIAGMTGCAGTPGFNFCAGGSGELAGTGYGDPDMPCGAPNSTGGGTGWVTTEAPILQGEIITVQFIVWDSSDPVWDSSSIYDNFHWLQGTLVNPITYRP